MKGMRPINREKEKLAEDYILKNYEYDADKGEIYSNRFGNKKEIGSISKSTGYKVISIWINNKIILLSFHRVAWFLFYKIWPDKYIDHINQDKLDNRILNLRLASNQENKRNVSKQKNNTSGFKNVSKHGKGWRVGFQVDDKNKSFGTYKTAEEANNKAREIEKELYGKFAPL